jgi:hypothetical protein
MLKLKTPFLLFTVKGFQGLRYALILLLPHPIFQPGLVSSFLLSFASIPAFLSGAQLSHLFLANAF